MCLISVIPKGIKKDEKLIRGFITQGMSSNRDGSGYSIKKNGKLFLRKGFRDPEEMTSSIVEHKLGINDELVIHHRIGTSGKKDDINMHPFIISQDAEEMKTIEGFTDKPILAHNGVFFAYSDYHSDFSDTFHFINKFLSIPEFIALMIRDKSVFEKQFDTKLGSNRLAILCPERDMILIGTYQEDEGCFHSNGGYKKTVYDYGGSSSVGQTAYGRNSFRYPNAVNSTKGRDELPDFENMDEADWDYYHSMKGIGTAKVQTSVVGKGLDHKLERSKLEQTLSNLDVIKGLNLKFESRDIDINADNFNHFVFMFRDKVYNYASAMSTNKGYEIEEFTGTEFTPVIATSGPRQIFHITLKNFLPACDIYVKSAYRELYRGLFKLIQTHGYSPSKAVKKKISVILNKKRTKDSFRFKEYGVITWNNLYNYSVQVIADDSIDMKVLKNKAETKLVDFIEHTAHGVVGLDY